MRTARTWLRRESEIRKGAAMDISVLLIIVPGRSEKATIWSAPAEVR